MIAEYKLYHGAVLADIIDRADFSISFREHVEEGRLLNYVLNSVVGLQIKFATQRLRPWHFSFSDSQIETLEHLQCAYQAAFLVLVCRTDGMIAAPLEDVLPSLRARRDGQSWLRADRKKREMYRLYGPIGELAKRFGVTSDPIVEAVKLCSRPEDLNDFVPHTTSKSAVR